MPPFISLCQCMISLHTVLLPPSIYNTTTFLLSLPPLFLPSFLLFSPTNLFHRSPPPPFILWPSNPGLRCLWLHWERANQETVWCVDGCLWRCLLRWVFIEIGAVFVFLAQRQPFRLCFLSPGTLCLGHNVLFHGGLVILQRCAIIGICRGAQCVCVFVSKKVRQNERD